MYSVSDNVWVFIDPKDESAPNGWRVAGICEGASKILVFQWNPVVLDGVSFPNARIAAHYQDPIGRVWIAFSADATHSQPILASYWRDQWTRYQLPAEITAIHDDAILLRVGNDLWVENPETTTFTILEDLLTEK